MRGAQADIILKITRLCQSPGPLKIVLLLPKRGAAGFSCQEENSCDRRLLDRLGHPEQQQDSLRLMGNPYIELAPSTAWK